MSRKLGSYNVYSTQQEGGIEGDGRVGISFESRDLTYTEVNILIDELVKIAKFMRIGEDSEIPRSAAI